MKIISNYRLERLDDESDFGWEDLNKCDIIYDHEKELEWKEKWKESMLY